MEKVKQRELIYEGKEKGEQIFTNTPISSLKEIKTFGGSPKFFEPKNWCNILVFGDNLSVLKNFVSNPSIKEEVRLTYIDPPFSTKQEFRRGDDRASTVSSSYKDQLAYKDMLIGAEYLEFLRKRLFFLKELLASDGSIYVHIDWKEGHYVKALMDEIFGERNFINDIARIKCNPKNFKRKAFGNIKDIILFYSKTSNYIWNDSLTEYTEEQVRRLFPKIDKNGRRYTTNPLHAPGETYNGVTGQPWRGISPPRGRHWRVPPEGLEKIDRQGLIEWSKTGNPRKKIFADEFIKKKKRRQDIWEFKDPCYPKFPTEKKLEMLKVIIQASSNPSDLILDCFAGSGTTLVGAESLGRRWIGIDNSEFAIKETLKRLLSLRNISPFTLYNATDQLLPKTLQEFLK